MSTTRFANLFRGFVSLRSLGEQFDSTRANGHRAAPASQPTPERQAEWRLVARRAIEAGLELADELEAA